MDAVYILGIILVLILLSFSIFKKSLKLIFKIILNTAIGVVALICVNAIGRYIGVTIGINLVSALVVGVLGLPGVALLLLLQWLMII